jgi:hypothetical protein
LAGAICLYHRVNIQFLYFFPGPGRFAEEFQRRVNTGIADKAIDFNDAAQVFPAKMMHQFVEDHFKRFAMKGVIGMHAYFWCKDSFIRIA